MPHPRVALVAAGLSALSTSVSAQPFTTVVTHGFTVGSKGLWVQGMAEAILARAGEGSVYRYDPATGEWQLVASQSTPDDVVILIFNWTDESDGPADGPNWNYAQAAGDALYTALRDPRYAAASGPPDLLTGRTVHLLGHSRGACVMSETSRRLVLAGIPVDQVTTMDPHPVNGTLDFPLNFDWGDPVPMKWTGVSWQDNYWRADGGFFNAGDFDGIPLDNVYQIELSESALECTESTTCLGAPDSECGYGTAHSDTHLWYHGTIDLAANPDDGEECISDLMRATWWPGGFIEDGFYFSALGGGVADRPVRTPGTAPGPVAILNNGWFEQGSWAGWLYHGGGGDAAVVNDGTNAYLQLDTDSVDLDVEFAHNRFWLPADATTVGFDYRLAATSLGGDTLSVRLRDLDGSVDEEIESIPFSMTSGWIVDNTVTLPKCLPRARAYTLTFRLEAGTGSGAVVHVDNVVVETGGGGCPWDCGDGDGTVGINDFLALLGTWGAPGACDFDCDGAVGIGDFLKLLGTWGACP